MLGLALRPEFLKEHLEAATTVLHDETDKTGAIDITANQFFEITYPATDLQRALHAISEVSPLRPIVLIAERGRGKTHILAAMHHAFQSPDVVEHWAHDWQSRGADTADIIRNLKLRRGYFPITTDMHRRDYLYLWDVLFKNHPDGPFFEGQFVAGQDSVPSHELIKKMLTKQPVALILDEFQSWFDSKVNKNDSADQSWAFSFIQVLSEIASERPDLLVLVVSVRDNNTDAYRQIHRNDPLQIDFKEATARRDRQRLVLHRLFANHHQIPRDEIIRVTAPYRQERFRLLASHRDAASQSTSDDQVLMCWPFSPELFTTLEDQILRSSDAQGLRDLLRILVHTYRAANQNRSILTLADFNIIDPQSRNVNTLIDAIVIPGQRKLREIAIRNYEEIQQAQLSFSDIDSAAMMSALWMRSFAVEEQKGASLSQLHVDMTHEQIIDDNTFNDALMQLIANSFNIHQTSESGEIRYIFREEENPRARLMARSKNNELFQDNQDITYLRNRIRFLLSPANIQIASRVIVLGPNWQTAPWSESEMSEEDRPERWERPALIVLPDYPAEIDATFGEWLVRHVNRGRNMIRFLLPDANKPGIFADPELKQSARIAYLAEEWKDTKYTSIGKEFQRKLDDALEKRFTRVFALQNWNYQLPKSCKFFSHTMTKPIHQVATEVDRIVRDEFFFSDLFESQTINFARNSQRVGDLLDLLREPPGEPNEIAIMYLGTTAINEQLVLLASQGKIALNLNGTWLIKDPNESQEIALQRIRNRGFVQGTALREMRLGLPDVVAPPTVAVPGDETQPDLFTDPFARSPDRETSYSAESQTQETIRETNDQGLPFSSTVASIPISRRVTRRSEKRKPLQMVSDIEQWRLQPREVIPVVRLSINNMSVADLKSLLGRMSTVGDASLEIEIEEKES